MKWTVTRCGRYGSWRNRETAVYLQGGLVTGYWRRANRGHAEQSGAKWDDSRPSRYRPTTGTCSYQHGDSRRRRHDLSPPESTTRCREVTGINTVSEWWRYGGEFSQWTNDFSGRIDARHPCIPAECYIVSYKFIYILFYFISFSFVVSDMCLVVLLIAFIMLLLCFSVLFE